MSEENKALVRRLFEELASKGDLAVADEITAPDFVPHDLASFFEEATGPEGVKQLVVGLRAAFPDLHMTMEDIIAEGDKVVIRYTARGTHKGEFQGLAPTGKRVAWAGINIYRVAGGKAVETWKLGDNLGLMQQLGVIPPMGQGG